MSVSLPSWPVSAAPGPLPLNTPRAHPSPLCFLLAAALTAAVSLHPLHRNGESSSFTPCEAPQLQLLSKRFLSPASLSPKVLGAPPVEARIPSLTPHTGVVLLTQPPQPFKPPHLQPRKQPKPSGKPQEPLRLSSGPSPSPSQVAEWSHPWAPHLDRPPQSSKQECVTGRHLADAGPHPPPSSRSPSAPSREAGTAVTPASQEGQPGPLRCRLRVGRASGCPAVSEASGSVFLAQAPCAQASGPLTSGRHSPGWRHHDSSMASCAKSRTTRGPCEVPGVQRRPRKLLSLKGGRPRPAPGPLRPEENHGKPPTAGREVTMKNAGRGEVEAADPASPTPGRPGCLCGGGTSWGVGPGAGQARGRGRQAGGSGLRP